MRDLRKLDKYRLGDWEAKIAKGALPLDDDDRSKVGAFEIPSGVRTNTLRVIAGRGMGWDHVSVSCSLPETPTWAEMEQIKRMFFKDDETAMQLHVPSFDHINTHPFTLHLWRPTFKKIPRPPHWMV